MLGHRYDRLRRIVAFVMSAFVAANCLPVAAVEQNWATAGVADWTTPANWSSASLPTATDWIRFRTTDPAPASEMTLDSAGVTGGVFAVQSIRYDLNTSASLGSSGADLVLLRLLGIAPGNPYTELLSVTGTGDFTIQPTSGSGVGALGLQLADSGSFRVVQAGTTLRISSVISEFGGIRNLTKLGLGTLELTASNTYTGATNVSSGVLTLGGDFGTLASKSISINGAGVLRLDNSASIHTNRLDDAAQLAFNAGRLEYIGNFAGTAETVGSLRVTAGPATIALSGLGTNIFTSTAGLTTNAGGTLTFSGLSLSNSVMLTSQATGPLPGGVYVIDSGTPEFAIYGLGGVAAMVDGSTTADYAAAATLTASRVSRPTGNVTQASAITLLGLRLGNTSVSGAGAITFNATSGTRSGILKTGDSASTIANPITIGATELVVRVEDASTGTLALNGIVSGSGRILTKTGPGALTLGAVNTYTGGTFVNQGTLKIGVASAINAASVLSIFSNATLDMQTFALSTTNTGASGLNFVGGGSLLGTGAAQLNLTANAAYQSIFGGESEALISARISMASWVVSSVTFTPVFNVADGDSEIDLTMSGVITNATGTIPFSKFGLGVMRLTNINTYTGATQVQQGALLLDYRITNGNVIPSTSALALGSGSATTVGSNGRVVLLGNDNSVVAGATVQNVAGLRLEVGSSNTIEMRPQSQNLTLNLGAITRLQGSTLNFAYVPGVGTATVTTTTANNTSGILGPYAVIEGRNWAAATGSTPFVIGPYSGYVDDVYTAGVNVNVTTSANIPTGTAVGTLRFNTASPITLTLAGSLSVPGILVTPEVGANTITIGGTGSSMLGTIGTPGELIVHQYNTAAPLILSTVVLDQSTTNVTQLVKTGPGTLILGGFTSTLTGGIRIEEGTLKFGNGSGLTSFTSNTNTRHIYLSAGATLDVSDVTVTNTMLNNNGGPGRVLLGNTGFYTIGDNGSSANLVHAISGGASTIFSKQSVGTLTISGDNTLFNGTFRIRNGGVSLASDASMGSPTATLSLENGVNNEWVSPYAARLFTTATFATSPTKKIVLNGKTGNRHVIDVAASTTFTMNGVISGTAGFIKTNTGTMILNAANTFAGTTQIDSGALTLSGESGSLINTPSVTINNLSTLTLDSTAAAFIGSGSRIAAADSQVVINGGSLIVLGNSGDSTELLNVIRLAGGPATITVQPTGGSAVLQLTNSVSGLDRDPTAVFSTALFRGLGLGSGAAGTARILVDNGLTSQLVGGGGAAGSTTLSILTYAVGDATNAGVGDSFVTYGQYGIRPLDATEYATYAAAGASDNVRIVSDTALVGKSINSVVFAPTAILNATGSGALNVASGAMLFNGTVATTISGFSAIDFGARQGMLWVNNTSTAGVTLSGGITGTAGLMKAGAGKLTITGASSYSGLTSINGGTLVVGNVNSLGVNPSLAVESGGTFDLAGSTGVTTFTLDRLLSTDYSGGTVAIGTKTLIVGVNGGSGTFSGTLTGTAGGTLVKEGAGELVLNGVNSFNGATIINGGTLTLIREVSNTSSAVALTAAVTVNPGATFHVSSQQNANNVAPFGATSTITLHNGTYAVSNLNTVTTGSGLNSNSPVVAVITLASGFNTFYSPTTPSLDSTTVTPTSLVRSQLSTLMILSPSNLANRALYRFPSINNTASNPNFVGGLGTTTNRSIVPWLVVETNLSKTGATFATLALASATSPGAVSALPLSSSGYATYTAATAADNVRITAGATIAGKTINALLLENASTTNPYTITGSGSLDITSGAIIFSGNRAVTVGGFSGLTTSATSAIVGEYIFHVSNAEPINWNVPLTTVGNAFTKSSAGTLVFGAANGYSGPTTINAGTLSVAQSDYLGDGSATNTLVFSGGTLAVTGSFTTARNMTFNIGGGTVSVASGQSLTLSGATTGAGGLTKTGAGTLIAAQSIAYSGKTIVREGTLIPGTGIASTSGPVTVGGGGFAARLELISSATISAPVTVAAQGTLVGNGTIAADLTIGSGGTISPGDTTMIGEITSAAGRTVSLGGGATFVFGVEAVEGMAGADWDYLSSVGTLQIGATSANPFSVQLTGDGFGFDPNTSYIGLTAWNFAQFDTLTGFDSAAFVVQTTGVFSSGLAAGNFYVSTSGNELYVNYQAQAVPEPGSLALIGLAGIGFWRHRRRRNVIEANAGAMRENVET